MSADMIPPPFGKLGKSDAELEADAARHAAIKKAIGEMSLREKFDMMFASMTGDEATAKLAEFTQRFGPPPDDVLESYRERMAQDEPEDERMYCEKCDCNITGSERVGQRSGKWLCGACALDEKHPDLKDKP